MFFVWLGKVSFGVKEASVQSMPMMQKEKQLGTDEMIYVVPNEFLITITLVSIHPNYVQILPFYHNSHRRMRRHQAPNFQLKQRANKFNKSS